MRASSVVIIAAFLTTLVAAALAATFAVYSSGVLPRAVRHDLGTASGTTFLVSGSVDRGQADQVTHGLPGQLSRALGHVPFRFDSAVRSDPLGFVAGARPAPPGGAGPGRPAGSGNGSDSTTGSEVPIAEAAAFTSITAHAALVTGHWPGQLRAGQPIPAALPVTAAALLHVRPGAVIQMRDRDSNRLVRFTITGLFRPRQVSGAGAAYWQLNDIGFAGAATSGGFTTYGPLTVNPAAFRGPLAVGAGAWLAQPDTAAIPESHLDQVAGRLSALITSLQSGDTLPSLNAATSLPAVLTRTASNLGVARSLLAICAVLIVLLAAAALLLVARLLAGAREGEVAMLAARGATRWQLARLTLAEAVPLSVVAAAAGGLAGVWLARLAAGAGSVPFGTALNQAWPAALVVAAGAVVIVLGPALRTVNPGAAQARRGRAAAMAGISRAGADVALVALAVLAGLELRRYSAVSAGSGGGTFGADPVLVIAPALALAGGTTAALRLLPLAARLGDRLAGRGRRLTAALASWQISRQPVRQGGAALLVVLAVATGALVIAQRQSWIGSGHDQAAFTAGADIRAEPPAPLTPGQAGRLSQAPGVTTVMPAVSFPAASGPGAALALNTGHAAAVTLLRADQAPQPAPGLLRRITPRGPAPGLTLPGRPAGIRLAAAIGPARLALDPVQVTVTAGDPDGDVYQLDAGTLRADGRAHTLTAALPGGTAIYPLRVIAITAAYQMPAQRTASSALFTVDRLTGTGAGATAAPGRPGTDLRAWRAAAASAQLATIRATFPGPAGKTADPATNPSAPRTAGSARAVSFGSGYGQGAGLSPVPITGTVSLTAPLPVAGAVPGLATKAFLTASKSRVGSVVEANLAGITVGVKIVAAVSSWPTVSGSGGAVVIDLGTLQNILAAEGQPPAQPTQWWLATSSGTAPPGLAARLPAGTTVTTATGLASDLLNDPVSVVPQRALLAVAITAVLLAITGFCVSIAAGVRQRRAENALLAALGVPPGAAASQLGLEKLLLSVPAALAGLALGVILAELLVPALTLTSSAAHPVPPVLIHFGWPQTLGLAVCVAVVPVLAAVLAMARRPDPAAALRAAEAA
ncbi:MAG TPA: FtsX-like permease family protein [Streptosporangiaceae bacterium]